MNSGLACRWDCLTVPLALAAWLFCAAVSPAGESEWTAIAQVRKAKAGLAEAYARVVTAHAQDAGVREQQQRIKLFEQAATEIRGRLESMRSAYLSQVAGDVGVPGVAGNSPALSGISPIDLYEQYQEKMPSSGQTVSLPESEQRILDEYVQAILSVAEDDIAKRGQSLIKLDRRRAADVYGLCAVLPLLCISDQKWATEHAAALPDCLRSGPAGDACEEFALALRRPRTAYTFWLLKKVQAAPNAEQTPYTKYLALTGERLVERRDYQTAIFCLRTAIAAAEAAKEKDGIAGLRLKLARMLRSAGNYQLAAAEVKGVLEDHPNSPECGAAAVLRLVYLAEDEQYATVAEEAPRYEAEKRYAAHLKGILYVHWAALTKLQQTYEAKKLQEAFLSKFPDDGLAVDMYYTSAVAALIAGDGQEARRLLELVEQRFPQSPLVPKAKLLRERISNFASTNKP